MHFGTCIEPAGGVHFRLWAPQARRVDLCLTAESAGKKPMPMVRQADGWFALHHQAAKPGDLYQFMINGDLRVPDPASRRQAGDIHGPSVVCDPQQYIWHDAGWQGRPWEDAVIYELHVGAFSPQGTFKAITERLDYFVQLGITAIECMPIAQFPGEFNWGYDGALLFAPCSIYGKPEDFKELVDAAHRRNIMVFLDVVYNHFGPEGNYLYVYARDAFFTEQFETPWGAAINFCGSDSRVVRDFYLANALYWLTEYHLDGLRLDAVHTIFDHCCPDILQEIAGEVARGPGRQRHIHLILENDNNCAGYLARKVDGRPESFTAQWNDDYHHACHVLLTDETEGYYEDYSAQPIRHLGRCLTEGFAYQGERSTFRQNEPRGEPSAHLPPLAFVSFLQNHDQVGNRALGERLTMLTDPSDLKILIALLLLAPSPPLLFMGEEFGARTPFCFFCDFSAELADSIVEGRRKEFAGFAQFSTPESRLQIPDPLSRATFLSAKLDWQAVGDMDKNTTLQLYRQLLHLRRQVIVPLLRNCLKIDNKAGFQILAQKAMKAWWQLAEDTTLTVLFNLHDYAVNIASESSAPAIGVSQRTRLIYGYPAAADYALFQQVISPKSIVWLIDKSGDHNE